MFYMFYSHEKSISRKNTALPIEKFPSLVLSRNAMLQHLIIRFPVSRGRLRELKSKRKFQTLNSDSGRGRLREVFTYKRF